MPPRPARGRGPHDTSATRAQPAAGGAAQRWPTDEILKRVPRRMRLCFPFVSIFHGAMRGRGLFQLFIPAPSARPHLRPIVAAASPARRPCMPHARRAARGTRQPSRAQEPSCPRRPNGSTHRGVDAHTFAAAIQHPGPVAPCAFPGGRTSRIGLIGPCARPCAR